MSEDNVWGEDIDVPDMTPQMREPSKVGGEIADKRYGTTVEQMMIFVSEIASGTSPFEAAKKSGHPLSYWRGLARRDEAFAAAYREAMRDYGHAQAHEALEIADSADVNAKAGVLKAKMQADLRLRMARYYNPHDFGEKVVPEGDPTKRKTQFVSYFGHRDHKQLEPSAEQLAEVLSVRPSDEEANEEEVDAADGGQLREEADQGGAAADEA